MDVEVSSKKKDKYFGQDNGQSEILTSSIRIWSVQKSRRTKFRSGMDAEVIND